MANICLRRNIIFLPRLHHPLLSLLHPKFIHEHSSPPSELDLSNPNFMIYGSNTGVGKTLVSTGIASSILSASNPSNCFYIKPVQTGFPIDSDSRFVYLKVPEIFRSRNHCGIFASNRVLNVSMAEMGSFNYEESGEEKGCKLVCLTMYGWREAVSPHLAVEREGMAVDDCLLREELRRWLSFSIDGEEKGGVWRLVETAGGVASPGPSGSLQCDLYR